MHNESFNTNVAITQLSIKAERDVHVRHMYLMDLIPFPFQLRGSQCHHTTEFVPSLRRGEQQRAHR